VAKPKPKTPGPQAPLRPVPLTPNRTTKFKQDAERLKKRGKDMEKLRAVVESLAQNRVLAPKHKDHALTGNLRGWRECHIEPDWLLIYKREVIELVLGRTGTHSDLGME
jgi:mRNA interferase YafQ